jgi:tRNA uridine 5-carboxymethylaminomethyl modification enzyme
LEHLRTTPNEARRAGVAINQDGRVRTAFDLLSRPDQGWADLSRLWPELTGVPEDLRDQIEIDARYGVYLDRQAADIKAFRRDEELSLPADLDYGDVGGLSIEARQRLAKARPASLGQAARLEGITPAALTALLAHVKRRGRARQASR